MVVDTFVHVMFIQICLWVSLVSSESAVNCLTTIESQLKDSTNRDLPHGWISQNGRVERWGDRSVLSIDLGGFGLQGEFPSGVKECSNLASLNLSGNNLSGTLPSDLLAYLPYLVTLDLSFNSFSGKIPANWSNTGFLNVLLLDHNHFTGHIPRGLASSPRLKQFSVAHNQLTGPIPEFTTNVNISLASFEDNLDLCGFPLDPCPDSFSLMSIVAAVISAIIFFPVGAAIGWFCVGALAMNRPRRQLKATA